MSDAPLTRDAGGHGLGRVEGPDTAGGGGDGGGEDERKAVPAVGGADGGGDGAGDADVPEELSGLWVIPRPGSCPSSPVSGALTSRSEWLSRALARCATWSGKPMPWRSWRRVFGTASWMAPLSGWVTQGNSMP